MKRCATNCSFYPGCYIAGDCGFEDWRTHDCGLPRAEQVRIRDKWWADLQLRQARWRLGERLKKEAERGDHDHLLAPIEAFGRDATRLDGEATKAGNSSKPNNIGETNDR